MTDSSKVEMDIVDETKRQADGRESGVALLIVLIVLVLTSILAVEIKRSAALHRRLAANQRDSFLMREAMRGQLEVLKQVLLYDLKENQVETLDDIWLDEKYTEFQDGVTEEEAEQREDNAEPVSSTDIKLEARIEDEARKFNLHNLVAEDDDVRAYWEKVFKRLLVGYREDFSQHAISEAKAEDLLKDLRDWLERENNDRGIPRPETPDDKRIMVTPDELLMVRGFTREMLYDLPPDEEGEDSPPGLSRFLTLWSAGPVNLNTADPVMVRAMFERGDQDLAENLISWRDEEAEEQPDGLSVDDDPVKNHLSNFGDFLKINGFDQESIQRNKLGPPTVAFRSDIFSVHLTGESPDGLRRQERYVLQRGSGGFTTILMEERNDPSGERGEEE